MLILFEDRCGVSIGKLLKHTAYHTILETITGRIVKINKSLLYKELDDVRSDALNKAAELASEIDLEFLWECCEKEMVHYTELANMYFGEGCSLEHQISILIANSNNKLYFYKKDSGNYKKALKSNIESAIANLERKRKEEIYINSAKEQLIARKLPDSWNDSKIIDLLFTKDNSPDKIALQKSAYELSVTEVQLMHECGAIKGPLDYHNRSFFKDYKMDDYDEDITPSLVDILDLSKISTKNVSAFSIDDVSTKEIDDAFSYVDLGNNKVSLGIHISALAISFLANSRMNARARNNLSTIYTPGKSYPMLPDSIVKQYSLDEGQYKYCISMYLVIDTNSLEVEDEQIILDRVFIADNLRIGDLEIEGDITAINAPSKYTEAIDFMFSLAKKFMDDRSKITGKLIQNNYPDYVYVIDNMDGPGDPEINITTRNRGSAIDILVSELMIAYNSRTAILLSESNISAVFRGNASSKVSLSSISVPHNGIGSSAYMWASSPIRRFVDLINQRQLLSIILDIDSFYGADEIIFIIREFEDAYSRYIEFQRKMERFWTIYYINQRSDQNFKANITWDSNVRLIGLPLYCRLSSNEVSYNDGEEVTVRFKNIDLWSLSLNAYAIKQDIS